MAAPWQGHSVGTEPVLTTLDRPDHAATGTDLGATGTRLPTRIGGTNIVSTCVVPTHVADLIA